MIFNHISYILAGIALLLYSLRISTKTLEHELQRGRSFSLQLMTKTPFRALLFGTVSALLVQLSSVSVISTMGLLERGLITLEHSLFTVLGAAFGSALKGLYISSMIQAVIPFLLAGGTLGAMTCKTSRMRGICELITSIGISLLAFHLIDAGLSPMARTETVHSFLNLSQESGILAVCVTVLAGTALAVLLQSSSAVMLVLMGVASKNLISMPSAIAIVLGANVGSAMVPLWACINRTSTDAFTQVRRLAFGHFFMRLMATILVLIFFRTHTLLLEDSIKSLSLQNNLPVVIASFYSWFSLMNALSWWAFIPALLKFLARSVPERELGGGTSPFTLKLQHLLGSMPGRALSEGSAKIQQVVRDLHWTSDAVFHVFGQKHRREDSLQLLEEGVRRCEHSVEVLNTVRDMAWRYLNANHSGIDSKNVLQLITISSDLKNYQSILVSCIQTLIADEKLLESYDPRFASTTLLDVRTQLNEAWEKLHSLSKYENLPALLDSSKVHTDPLDVILFETKVRLGFLERAISWENKSPKSPSRTHQPEVAHSSLLPS